MVPKIKFGSEPALVGVAELVSVTDGWVPTTEVIVVDVCLGRGSTTVSVLVTVPVVPPSCNVRSGYSVELNGSSESRVPGSVTCLRWPL